MTIPFKKVICDMFTPTSLFKKIVLRALILLAFSLAGPGEAKSQSVYRYDVEKVVDDVYVLKPVINSHRWVTANIVVIVNRDDVFVVDSGLLPEAANEAIREIRKITQKPVTHLVNTHWHGDHWQGNEAFVSTYPAVNILATEQGYKGIARNGMVWATQFYNRYFQMMLDRTIQEATAANPSRSKSETAELQEGVDQLKQDVESMKNLKPVLPNTTFSERMVIRRGSREIQLHYLGIGNTSGDAVVYLPAEKVLIAGDLVVHPSPYESAMFSPEWLETSEKLAAFDYTYLVPGHGAVQRDHGYLDFLNRLFREIIDQILAAYKSGKGNVDEVAAVVTHSSVVQALDRTSTFKKYTGELDPGFVPAAVKTSFKRIVQGKL